MAEVKKCRICGSGNNFRFLDLGRTPLANSFLKSAEEQEESFPLNVFFCEDCGLVQLGYIVPPEKMFTNYIYFSSTSDTMRRHFAAMADEILNKFAGRDSLVVEVASNDGILLRNMLGKNVRILGVEPAENVAKFANESGVPTLNEFFNSKTAKAIAGKHGKARVVIANNVFAHIPDLHDFVGGLDSLLEADGVAMIEVPYLADMYEKKEFDTIYHEHLAYFSIKPLMRLFGMHSMEIFDVKRMPVHGGTIRLYIQRKGAKHTNSAAAAKLMEMEAKMGLHSKSAHEQFSSGVERLKDELVGLLRKLKAEGKRVVAYGAPAKGNTLLNYFRIGRSMLDYAVDKSEHKVGLFTPGARLPIYGVSRIAEDMPDYVLILAWNFTDEIVRQQHGYREKGGKFIVPVPEPKII
jgi:hypothetical protein